MQLSGPLTPSLSSINIETVLIFSPLYGTACWSTLRFACTVLTLLCKLDHDSPSPMRPLEKWGRPMCLDTGRGWSLELSKQTEDDSTREPPWLYRDTTHLLHARPQPCAPWCLENESPSWVSQVEDSLTRAAPCAGSWGAGSYFPAQGAHLLPLACDPSLHFHHRAQ